MKSRVLYSTVYKTEVGICGRSVEDLRCVAREVHARTVDLVSMLVSVVSLCSV